MKYAAEMDVYKCMQSIHCITLCNRFSHTHKVMAEICVEYWLALDCILEQYLSCIPDGTTIWELFKTLAPGIQQSQHRNVD